MTRPSRSITSFPESYRGLLTGALRSLYKMESAIEGLSEDVGRERLADHLQTMKQTAWRLLAVGPYAKTVESALDTAKSSGHEALTSRAQRQRDALYEAVASQCGRFERVSASVYALRAQTELASPEVARALAGFVEITSMPDDEMESIETEMASLLTALTELTRTTEDEVLTMMPGQPGVERPPG